MEYRLSNFSYIQDLSVINFIFYNKQKNRYIAHYTPYQIVELEDLNKKFLTKDIPWHILDNNKFISLFDVDILCDGDEGIKSEVIINLSNVHNMYKDMQRSEKSNVVTITFRNREILYLYKISNS